MQILEGATVFNELIPEFHGNDWSFLENKLSLVDWYSWKALNKRVNGLIDSQWWTEKPPEASAKCSDLYF